MTPTPDIKAGDRITVAASEAASTSRKTPPNRPTGVRSGSQMTASRGAGELIVGVGSDRPGPSGREFRRGPRV